MTIQALGTNATNSLTAFQWRSVAASQASVRAINVLIRDDQNARHPLAQTNGTGGFVKEGLLTVPNRGVLQLFPGDVVGVDATSGIDFSMLPQGSSGILSGLLGTGVEDDQSNMQRILAELQALMRGQSSTLTQPALERAFGGGGKR